MTIKTAFPELNANQLKQLHRLMVKRIFLTIKQVAKLDQLFWSDES